MNDDIYLTDESKKELIKDIKAYSQNNTRKYNELVFIKKHDIYLLNELNTIGLINDLNKLICEYADEIILITYDILNSRTLNIFNMMIFLKSKDMILNKKEYEFDYGMYIKYNYNNEFNYQLISYSTNKIYTIEDSKKNKIQAYNTNILTFFNEYMPGYNYMNINSSNVIIIIIMINIKWTH